MCIAYFQWLTHRGRSDRALCEAISSSRDCIRNVSRWISRFPDGQGTSKEHIFSELTVHITHLTKLFRVDIDNQLRSNDVEGACNITKSKLKGLGGDFWSLNFSKRSYVAGCIHIWRMLAGLMLQCRITGGFQTKYEIFLPKWNKRFFTAPTSPPTPNPVCAFRKVNDRIPEINAGFYVTLYDKFAHLYLIFDLQSDYWFLSCSGYRFWTPWLYWIGEMEGSFFH